MKMRDFIRENREELDSCINNVCHQEKRNDREREMWILNDEGLYNWARGEGVRI